MKVKHFDGSFFYSEIVVLQRRPVDLDIINIFPNPFIDNFGFTFNTKIDESITVNLYEASGKLVYSETGKFTGIYKEIETKSYPKGVYFLQVIIGNKQFYTKKC
ncbi:MAG: T9SS type A sorting domain-containing protein [Saprospiraceae bacterium]|nr:T9SS type A sorting domain-containing protein [Saprospiraceae bacterium]